MNKYMGARWFKGLPFWVRIAVHNLTGWQVIRTTIRHRVDAGLFAYVSEHQIYVWSRSKERVRP